jgi:hypothetical protein
MYSVPSGLGYSDDGTGAPVYYVVPESQPSDSESVSQFGTETTSSGMTIDSDDLSGSPNLLRESSSSISALVVDRRLLYRTLWALTTRW